MQALRTEHSRDDQVILACFEVSGQVYALDVAYIREVVRWQPVTPLPKAPRLIEGVIDLRNAVVPVVDLGRALHSEPIETGSLSRIAITEVDGLVFGLAVDAAIEVLPVDVEAMEDPPGLATQAGYDAIRAVVRRSESTPIVVLSPEHLLESVYRSALPSPEDMQ
jgi:purine-binding chemotaxis protein CheW